MLVGFVTYFDADYFSLDELKTLEHSNTNHDNTDAIFVQVELIWLNGQSKRLTSTMTFHFKISFRSVGVN